MRRRPVLIGLGIVVGILVLLGIIGSLVENESATVSSVEKVTDVLAGDAGREFMLSQSCIDVMTESIEHVGARWCSEQRRPV